eukprot:6543039-Pyramimonas_sp.AAC.1
MQIEAGDHASRRTVAVARTGPRNSRRVQASDGHHHGAQVQFVASHPSWPADGTTPALPAPLETNPTTS